MFCRALFVFSFSFGPWASSNISCNGTFFFNVLHPIKDGNGFVFEMKQHCDMKIQLCVMLDVAVSVRFLSSENFIKTRSLTGSPLQICRGRWEVNC